MKNRSLPAFSLLELMLYLSLTTGLLYAVFAFFSTSYKNFFAERVFCTRVVRDTIVFDLLKRDLLSASMQLESWVASEGIFKQETISKHGITRETWIGWHIVPDGLYRCKGTYDPVRKRWTFKRAYFFTCSCKELRFVLHLDKQQRRVLMTEISYRMGNAETTMQEFVPLRNRIL